MILAISHYPDPTARTGIRISANNKLIDNFLGGLHRHVRQHLLAQKFHTIDDAIENTIRLVTKIQYHAERFRANNRNESPRVQCNYCGIFGHLEAECRKKLNYRRNYNPSNNQPFSGRDSSRVNNNQNMTSTRNNFPGRSYENRDNRINNTLNYRGPGTSAQRLGQQVSRANPIEMTGPPSAHIPSELPPETLSESHFMNSEHQPTNFC